MYPLGPTQPVLRPEKRVSALLQTADGGRAVHLPELLEPAL